jgi:zinc protease
MLDRTVPPPFRAVDRPKFSWPETYQLKEGFPLFVLKEGSQPIIKLELICDAGSWYEPHNGVAYFTAKMLQEGTEYKSARDIARYIDQYGASFHAQVRPDTCTFTLTTLSKHLAPMLALLAELLLAPTFDAQRLVHIKQLTIQKLKVDAQRNSHVAHKKLKAILFDGTHPYGRHLTKTVIDNITPAHLQHYYRDQLLAGCRLLVSGQVQEKDLQTIQQYLQPLPIQAPDPALCPWPAQACAHVHLKKEGSLQAAIRVGKVLFTKDHPDYLPLLVVNELLGGYFGSRLMRNIREDKGYTYGIFSNIVSLKHTSYLLIATEVTQAFAQATCREIAKEIEVLQTTPVPESELKTHKNYMIGTFLSEINDPFAVMEKFKAVHLHGLDQVYYEQWYDAIQRINPFQIMALANAYLNADELSQVIVG